MEDINNIRKKLTLSNFTFYQEKDWNQLRYVWADYFYMPGKNVVAKYLFIHIDRSNWTTLLNQNREFISDIIEPVYYSLNNDLRWNLYFICIADDDELRKIDRYEKRNFENNRKYTRNFLIPGSQIEKRIPVGRVFRETAAGETVYPAEEWRKALTEYPRCLEGFAMQVLEDYLNGKSQASETGSHPHTDGKTVCISSLQKIRIPKRFRPHFYQKDWSLPCGKFNLLFGANGTGKTSILSGIELAVTGTIYKPSKYIEKDIEGIDIVIDAEGSDGSFSLERPLDQDQKAKRETEWYNFDSDTSHGRQLNSLFHRFNYFSVEDPYRFSTVPHEMDQVFSRLLFGVETLQIWENIQVYRTVCQQKHQEIADLCQSLRTRLLQPPPKVETILEDTIRTHIEKYNLKIPENASIGHIKEVIASIYSSVKPLSGFGTIPNRAAAEGRLEKLQQELATIDKNQKKLDNKIRRYESLQLPIDTHVLFHSPAQFLYDKLWKLTNQKNQFQADKKKLKDEKEMLIRACEFWDNVSLWLSSDTDISGHDLFRYCKKALEMIKEFKLFQQYIQEYTSLEAELANMELKLDACKKLDDRLSQLCSPEKYAQHFIEANLAQITQIFVNLHIPQEFSDLKIIEGEIVGIRSGEVVPLINMSTGQRTALVFAIFFQLNLSNNSSPRFLLVDEPVANIDDLNALLLMDFMRELVITYDRQLFVTTANRNVAMLLRRKFSFLNESLCETSFYRESKDLLQIVQRKYDQRQLLSEDDL